MKKLFFLLILVFVTCCVYSQDIDFGYKYFENAHHKFKTKKIETTKLVLGENKEEDITETVLDIDETVLSVGEINRVKQGTSIVSQTVNGKDTLNDLPDEIKNSVVIYEQNKKGKCVGLYKEDGSSFPEFNASEEEPIFPDEKIKVSGSWIWNRDVMGTKVPFKCTLEKIYSKDGVDIAKINIEIDDNVKLRIIDFETYMDAKVTGSGVFYYAVNYGNDLYLDYELQFNVPFPVKTQEGPAQAEIIATQTYKYWRCN